MNIKGKTAIVTGASSGIGAVFSKALIDNGAVVYGLARSEDKLQKLRDEFGESFVPVKMDVTRHDDIEAWTERTFGDSNAPDILIN
ncbi:MAG: SDR family NAD(P)-dependent oxidoreductase, partial [Balneolaceae bacterium]|nr:SDR family NAD(P)-dependent oxidoreductase [Balneolaceae bacterium]